MVRAPRIEKFRLVTLILSVSNDKHAGPGLVFQVYPEGLATMRFSAMWSVLFFMMVITLGIDSTVGEEANSMLAPTTTSSCPVIRWPV
jgi:SNF family Na+-dependent transporter